MFLDAFDRFIYHRGVIYDRGDSDFLNKLVPCLTFAVCPVVYGHERCPADASLLDVRSQDIGVEFIVVCHFDLIPAQTVFAVLQGTGRAAGRSGQKRRCGQYCEENSFHAYKHANLS